MIKSEIITIKKIENFDNLYIEKQLSLIPMTVVRWAIIDIDNTSLKISVSYY